MKTGATQKAGPLRASASISSQGVSASGVEGFRGNWQSQLASLGVTEDGGGETGSAGKAVPAQAVLVSGKRVLLPAARSVNSVDSGATKLELTSPGAAQGTPKSLLMQLLTESAAAKTSRQTALNGSTGSKARSSKGEHAAGEVSHSAKGNAAGKDSKTLVAGAALAATNVPVPVAAPVAVTNAQPKAARISDSHSDANLPGSRNEISASLAALGASAAMSRLSVAVDGGPAGKDKAAQVRKTADDGQKAAAVEALSDAGREPAMDSARTEAAVTRTGGQATPATSASVAQARLQTGAVHIPERSSAPGELKAGGTNTPVAAMAGGAAQSPDAGAPADLPATDASSSVASVAAAGGRHSAGQAAGAAARVSSGTAEREKRGAEGQAAGTGVEASTLGRDPGGTRGIATAASGNSGSTASAAPASGHDTFAALDAGTNTGAPSWVHAGAQHAEAGFQDPSLGWVSVRANVSGGAVHAALVPGSSDAAQALAGHLAGLNSHLAAEHMAVHPVTVAPPSWSSGQSAAHQGSQQGSHQGSYQGSYGGAGQNSGRGGYAQPQGGTTLAAGRVAGPVTAIPVHAVGPSSSGGVAGRSGAYISVIA